MRAGAGGEVIWGNSIVDVPTMRTPALLRSIGVPDIMMGDPPGVSVFPPTTTWPGFSVIATPSTVMDDETRAGVPAEPLSVLWSFTASPPDESIEYTTPDIVVAGAFAESVMPSMPIADGSITVIF